MNRNLLEHAAGRWYRCAACSANITRHSDAAQPGGRALRVRLLLHRRCGAHLGWYFSEGFYGLVMERPVE